MQRRWMQWILWGMAQSIPIECSGFHAAWRNGTFWMQWILCSMIECSGFHAASLNAEYSMHWGAMDPDFMQWSPCSVMNAWIPGSLVKCIPIECSGLRAAWLNAVDFMQHGPKLLIECSGLRVAWLNAVNSMQYGKMHPNWMQWILCIAIECSVIHAVW